MTASAASLQNARLVFADRKGILRTSEALRAGIHPRVLYALRDRGEIEEISRGLYRLTSRPPLPNPDLIAVALRIPRGIVCLISALAWHGLTTQVPHTVDIALPGHAQVPRFDTVPVRVFWYSEQSYNTGVDTVELDDVPVKIFGPEKSVADCFKYRNKLGLDVALESLRTYRERSRFNHQLLFEYAKINRVERVMRPYIEALL